MIVMDKFDLILKEIQEVMKKYGVEMRIKSEITFVNVDAKNTDTQTNNDGKSGDRKS